MSIESCFVLTFSFTLSFYTLSTSISPSYDTSSLVVYCRKIYRSTVRLLSYTTVLLFLRILVTGLSVYDNTLSFGHGISRINIPFHSTLDRRGKIQTYGVLVFLRLLTFTFFFGCCFY